MRLGGTVTGAWKTPEEWEALLVQSRFRAVTAPFDCRTPRDVTDALREALPTLPVTVPETLCVKPTAMYEGFFAAALRKEK